MAWLRNEGAVFLQALQFLTRLPLPAEIGYTPERLAASPRYYGLVGAIIGVLMAVIYGGTVSLYGPLLGSVLAMAASVFLTGAFHEDGFADACDGLGGADSSQRVLEIMQDSRLGTYGALGLGLMVTAKVLALGQLPSQTAMILLVVGHCASRASSVLVIATSGYVRLQGKAKPVATGISGRGLGVTIATVAAALALGTQALGPLLMASACTGLVLGHLAMRACFERRLGGYTGDCLGAVQQTSELGLYLGALAWL